MKLKQFNFDEYKDYDYSKFGKYPKTKYSLLVFREVRYSFVTTCRSERESLEILSDMASVICTVSPGSYYKIISECDGIKKKLKTGKVKLNL